MQKDKIFILLLMLSGLCVYSAKAYTDRYTGDYTSVYSQSKDFISDIANPFDNEYYQKEYKEKVEVFCAPGGFVEERCSTYCGKLKIYGGAHALCGNSASQEKVQKYVEKVDTFCAIGVEDREKCKKYCADLGFSGKTNELCNNNGSFKSSEYRDKIKTFCAPGVDKVDKCNNYCDKLSDIGETHEYCGNVIAKKIVSKTDNKKTIENENGTTTEVSVESNSDSETETRTTFSNDDEIKRETIETVENADGSKYMTTTISMEGREEIASLFFDKDDKKYREEIQLKENDGIRIKVSYFDESENLKERTIKNKTSEDGEESIVSSSVYNGELKKHNKIIENGNSLEYLVKDGKISESRVVYDKNVDEILVYDSNVLNESFDEKEGGKKFTIKSSEEQFIIISLNRKVVTKISLLAGNESGKLYVKSNEQKSEVKFMPNSVNDKAMENLSQVNVIEIINEGGLKYRATGKVDKKILGILNISLNSNSYYDISDGALLGQETQTIWEKIKSTIGWSGFLS